MVVSQTHIFSQIAKQAGVMPTSWLAINYTSCDRTPEIKIGVLGERNG